MRRFDLRLHKRLIAGQCLSALSQNRASRRLFASQSVACSFALSLTSAFLLLAPAVTMAQITPETSVSKHFTFKAPVFQTREERELEEDEKQKTLQQEQIRSGEVTPLSRQPLTPVQSNAAIGSLAIPAQEPKWAMFAGDMASSYNNLPDIERELFGHPYPQYTLEKRLSRIEAVLFGKNFDATTARIPNAQRMQAITARLNDGSQQAGSAQRDPNRNPILSYLETRLFQRIYETIPLPNRLRQLEMQVFGHSFDSYPSSLRIKKLTYAMPIVARQIRLTNSNNDVIASTLSPRTRESSVSLREEQSLSAADDVAKEFPVVADTLVAHRSTAIHPVSQHHTGAAAKKSVIETVSFDADAPQVREKPQGQAHTVHQMPLHPQTQTETPPFPDSKPRPVSGGGNYINAIHRQTDGTVLRWENLPVRVYFKPDDTASDSENAVQLNLLSQIVHSWSKAIVVQMVDTPMQTDILVSWSRSDWMENTQGLIIRPVTRLDAQKHLRTMITIDLFPTRGEAPAQRLRLANHAFGHALGLWGHSSQPADVMFPAFELEKTDFPERWATRSRSALMPENQSVTPTLDSWLPSSRDMETLDRIYELPATNLKNTRL